MFGKNPIREIDRGSGESLAVQEIFYTIQGEGPQAGRVATFIRLAGCNLACAFCDTDFESNIDQRMGVDEIITQVQKKDSRHDLVVLTGGEPLRQNVVPLIKALRDIGVKLVQIETAGTVWVEGLDEFCSHDPAHEGFLVQIVCSPKTPKIHREVLRWATDYKYIIEAGKVSQFDGLPIGGTQTGNLLNITQRIFRPWDDWDMAYAVAHGYGPRIWVSPCDFGDRRQVSPGWDAGMRAAENQLNTAAAVQSALTFGHRLSLQMHKIVGLP